ncbi:hypothetical protein ISF_01987 [Cordyceps fumosorosea ARSEF 2679]|uniref:NAD dependent epimerase/dehydratase n=1 Tax=Cordyceps fumosorosea (strain ARSEF 2679) TaxID=1081104 RepID=A0A168CIZ8_CORFA|nr:hypothetical protein ISF_01987 [Cordyceps fumosorosea ARSEF 2679]OAA71436.1 hypothetical protein ISF_01987 [Cordyceps fumosorosea ARSEF 2679]
MDHIKNSLYNLDVTPRTRTTPMRVLAVGPSRSGTGSLREALIQLGYDHTYHGFDTVLHPPDDILWHRLRLKRERLGPGSLTAADFDQVIGHCAAITDHAAAAFALDLIAAYPDAKVILNVRKDVDAWHRSVAETLIPLHRSWAFWVRSWFCAELFWVQVSFMRGNWSAFYRGDFDRNARSVLKEHCRAVRTHVAPDQLLEWEVQDGWGPLCEFLGELEPDRPFPTLNAGRNYAKLYRERIARADRNIRQFLTGLVLVATVAASAAYIVRRN